MYPLCVGVGGERMSVDEAGGTRAVRSPTRHCPRKVAETLTFAGVGGCGGRPQTQLWPASVFRPAPTGAAAASGEKAGGNGILPALDTTRRTPGSL